jgi:periplasmic protein TonB
MANNEVPRDDDWTRVVDKPQPGITPPKPRRQPKPEFPQGARHFNVEGILILEVVITADGKITAPMIIQPLPAPSLSYTALQALRRWEFEPAVVHGQPVPVIFNATFSYNMR